MANPFLKRNPVNDGRQIERKQAKYLKARLQPGSGNLDGAKGDMKTSEVLIEHKSTQSGSLPLKYDWLTKISKEAMHINRTPILMMTFVYPTGAPKDLGEWVAVPLWVAKDRGLL